MRKLGQPHKGWKSAARKSHEVSKSATMPLQEFQAVQRACEEFRADVLRLLAENRDLHLDLALARTALQALWVAFQDDDAFRRVFTALNIHNPEAK
jgi:hypothetical protein